jgi:MFS family permease
LEKVGARRWIARIMITWGLLSAGMMFVQGPTSFLVMRFLLGVAEAGFFPGIILYLTYWFPSVYRARIIAAFMVAIPVSLGLGAPLSTGIMELHGVAGLKGWQWLFLLEGLPTVLVGILVYKVLPDRPRNANWLSEQQKQWLQDTIDRENNVAQSLHGLSVWRIFLDPRVLGLAFIYFANTTANLGLAFFLPQIIKSIGLTNVQTGFVTAIPYVFGTAGILVWGYFSDHFNERRISLFLALAVAAIGLAGAAYLGPTFGAVALMAVAAIGIYGTKAPFWPLPSMFLTGSAAAGGIALINSIGNLGGFAGPYIVGWAKDVTNSFEGGLYALAALAAAAALLSLIIVKRNPEKDRSALAAAK